MSNEKKNEPIYSTKYIANAYVEIEDHTWRIYGIIDDKNFIALCKDEDYCDSLRTFNVSDIELLYPF